MDWLQTVLLALIQGITEFLPVSSSAHLVLPAQILDWHDQGLLFDVSVHLGTLVAVMAYFRRDLLNLLTGLSFKPKTAHYREEIVVLIIGTIPVVIAGFALNGYVESHLRSVAVIAFTTIFFGVLLWIADKQKVCQSGSINFTHGFIIGLAQMFAIIPGVSRSGVTITAARMLGYSSERAARFSFLLSIPVIGGAMLLLLIKAVPEDLQVTYHLWVGALISAVFAYVSIHWFLKLLERVGLMPFVIYRFILGFILVWFVVA